MTYKEEQLQAEIVRLQMEVEELRAQLDTKDALFQVMEEKVDEMLKASVERIRLLDTLEQEVINAKSQVKEYKMKLCRIGYGGSA